MKVKKAYLFIVVLILAASVTGAVAFFNDLSHEQSVTLFGFMLLMGYAITWAYLFLNH